MTRWCYGKGSLIGKMPGDDWQRFANLRAYFGFMWGHPGKKLLFMGGEFAQEREWNHDGELDWDLLDDPLHRGVQRLVRDLNRSTRASRRCISATAVPTGFRWVVGDDRAQLGVRLPALWPRLHAPVLVVCNMTPVPRHGYRIGVPRAGGWREICSTPMPAIYGGIEHGQWRRASTPMPVPRMARRSRSS